MTRQRRVIYESLVQAGRHVDANDLFEQVRKRYPGISLATVYRTVAVLKAVGLVKALPLGEGHQHFEPASDTVHYHLLCTACGRVMEFNPAEVAGAVAGLVESGWHIEGVEFFVKGRCPKCTAQKNV
jgi:Fe2+ or Zn2+ uptake regulation protein